MKYFGEYTEGMPEFDYRNLDESIAAERKWLADLPGTVVKFQIADGYAMYLYKDGGLYHLPVGDAYRVLPATIRGLTKSDVQAMIDWDRRMEAMMSRPR